MLILCLVILQIQEMKTQAVVIAAPFAFTLGLLASIFAVLLGMAEPQRLLFSLCSDCLLTLACLACSNQGVYMDICSSRIRTCRIKCPYILWFGEL